MTLPLIPNSPFNDGDVWSSSVAYLAFNQVFDDQTQYLGHQAKLTDTSLSDATGQIKDRLNTITNGLLVTVQSGLTLQYTSGVVRMTDGALLSIPAGLITAPDNSTNYVYVDTNGTLQVGTQPTVYRILLA